MRYLCLSSRFESALSLSLELQQHIINNDKNNSILGSSQDSFQEVLCHFFIIIIIIIYIITNNNMVHLEIVGGILQNFPLYLQSHSLFYSQLLVADFVEMSQD